MLVALIFVLGAALALKMPEPIHTTTGLSEVKCNMSPNSQYPPNPNRALPVEVIDLDAPTETRWAAIVAPRAAGIKALVAEVVKKLGPKIVNPILEILDQDAPKILSRFPADYGAELMGVANATGIDIGMIILYNIFYEVSSLCTSIVAQDSQGNVYHARNLDFGLFLGWNNETDGWAVAALLRPLLFTAQFVKGGVIVYNSTQYAGYIGILTGFKKGAFSITVDTRFDLEFDIPLLEWFQGKYVASFVGFLNRQVIENNATFADAVAILNSTLTVAPVYLIVGGANAGEGAVITRQPQEVLNVWTLQSELNNGSFFLLQTNYDHWKPAPFFDDRSGPGILCMEKIGQSGVNFAGLFNVLSAKPNLNMLTTYTALMHVASGEVQAFVQDCEVPCPPW